MSDSATPLVSIGMPVYNGEDYLEGALRSILDQDFTDLELLISDNASTDRTPEILEAWAAKDSRIVLHSNTTNVGASANFNRVLKMARGRYFRWACHDDVLAPGMLRACVTALESGDSSYVLVYPETVIIDEDGNEVEVMSDQLDLQEGDPVDRLRHFIRNYRKANVIYGMMRTDAIRSVDGLPAYNAGDLVMIAGVALRGRFREVPEPLFYRRVHPGMSWRASRTAEGFARWFEPSKRWLIVFQAWRLWRELFLEVWRAPLTSRQMLGATLVVAYAWPQREWRRLIKEIARIPLVLARSLMSRGPAAPG